MNSGAPEKRRERLINWVGRTSPCLLDWLDIASPEFVKPFAWLVPKHIRTIEPDRCNGGSVGSVQDAWSKTGGNITEKCFWLVFEQYFCLSDLEYVRINTREKVCARPKGSSIFSL